MERCTETQRKNATGTVKRILWHGTEQKTKTRGGGGFKSEEEAEVEEQEGEVR